jgi:Putative esterase
MMVAVGGVASKGRRWHSGLDSRLRPLLRPDPGGRRAVGWIGGVLLVVVAGAALLVTLYGPDSSMSLLDGPFPAAVIVLATSGLVVGVLGRPRRWWATWGLGLAGTAAAGVAVAAWWIRHTGLVDEHYPPSFLAWGWAGLVAVGLGLTGWWSGPALRRVVCVVTAPLTLFASLLLINSHYGYWPTMGALLHRPVVGQISAPALARTLQGQGDPGRTGTYGRVSIPGPPGFQAGGAWVWIPPAYRRVPPAHLSVLVMLPGVPGQPDNWEVAGEVVPLADAWAAAHGGVAPVMVFVSGNGAADRDTECVNGTQGAAETYLARTVPAFIVHRLGIRPGPTRWGVVGFSEGGTCALDLALEHPAVFGRFVDVSGELAPTFGASVDHTLTGLYAGNATAMLHNEPLWLLSHHTYPGTEGWLAGSRADHHDEKIASTLTDAARHAGVTAFDVSGGPGGHSWSFARVTFDRVYPALVAALDARPAPRVPPRHRRHLSFVVSSAHAVPPGAAQQPDAPGGGKVSGSSSRTARR